MSRSKRANAIIAVLGDRPVAYHPALARIIGVKEAVFVSQLLYWDGKGHDPGGWIYKTQAEWTDETGLSRYEQETVRKNLKERGVLHEKLKGVPARLWYKLDFSALSQTVEEAYPDDEDDVSPPSPHDEDDPQPAETPHPSLQKPRILESGTPASKKAEPPPAITENTAETNRDISLPAPPGRLVIDLDEVIELSNAGYRKNEYTFMCPDCGEDISQEDDRCCGCEREVVWKNSPTWRRLYGKPEKALRANTTPTDAAGRYLLQKANEGSHETPWLGFSSVRDFKDWARTIKEHGTTPAMRWIDHWFGLGKRGRGLVNTVLNSVKKWPDGPIKQRKESSRDDIATYGSLAHEANSSY